MFLDNNSWKKKKKKKKKIVERNGGKSTVMIKNMEDRNLIMKVKQIDRREALPGVF